MLRRNQKPEYRNQKREGKNQRSEYSNQDLGFKTGDGGRWIKDEKLFPRFSLKYIFWLLVTGYWFLFVPPSLYAADYSINPDSFDHTKFMPPEYLQLNNYAFTVPTNTGVAQVGPEVPVYSTDDKDNLICRRAGEIKWVESQNGDKVEYLNGQKARKVHANGTRLETYCWQGGGWLEVLNQFGERKGYEQHSMKGLLARYNSKQHILESYAYDADKKGYWAYDHVTQISKRYEMEKPVREMRREGDKDSLIATWTEEGDYLYRHSSVQIFVRDRDGNIVTDARGLPQYEQAPVKSKYNKYNEILESYDYRGRVVEEYEWVDHRLKRQANLQDFTYRLYGDYGVIEEGRILEGEYIPDKEHLWQGSKHTAVKYLILDPLMGEGCVPSGQYMSYTVEEEVDEMGWEINRFNQEWFDLWCAGRNLPSFKEGDKVLEQDYVYFYEVQDLSVAQLKDFFHTSKATAEQVHAVIAADKNRGKAAAGLFAIAQYGLPAGPQYLAQMTLVDENNEEKGTVTPLEKTRALGMQMLVSQAQTFLEYGQYEKVLDIAAQFEADYVAADSEFDSELGKAYLEVLRYRLPALEKLGRNDEAAAQREFILATFSDLAQKWGGKYQDIIDQIT